MFTPTRTTGSRLFLIMVAMVFFLAYLVRWIYLRYYLSTAIILTDVNPDWNVIVLNAFDQAFVICALIFGAFFLTTAQFRPQAKIAIARTGYHQPSQALAVFTIILIGVTLVVRRAFGSVLGEAPADIPLGLGTLIFRAQADLFPGLLLLFAEAAWFASKRPQYWLWVAALAIFNLAMSLLTTSKAGLIFFAVQFLMLMYLTNQNIFSRPWRLALLAIGGIAVFIIGAQLRSQELLGVDALLVVAIQEGRIIETILEVVGLVANRLPGTEGLALYCGYECSGIPAFSVPALDGTAGQVFTAQVVGVNSVYDFRSPGYIGGAIIIAGLWGGTLLSVGFLRLMLAILRAGDQVGLSAAAKIAVCFGMFRFVLEGVWAWQDVASAFAAALVIELTARTLLRTRQADGDGLRRRPDTDDTYSSGSLAL